MGRPGAPARARLRPPAPAGARPPAGARREIEEGPAGKKVFARFVLHTIAKKLILCQNDIHGYLEGSS